MAAEDRADRAQRQWLEQFTNRTDPRAWTLDELSRAWGNAQSTGGVDQILRAGDVLPIISLDQLPQYGFSDITKILPSAGRSFQQYQSDTGATPFRDFNPTAGTMVYDPAALTNPQYWNQDGSGFLKFMDVVGPAFFGAGLTGLLPGTESIFGGLGGASGTAAGGGAAELASMADLGSSMLGGEIAGGIGATGAASGAASGLQGALGGLSNADIVNTALNLGNSVPTSLGTASGVGSLAPTVTGGALGGLTFDALGNIVPSTIDLANTTNALSNGISVPGSGLTPSTTPGGSNTPSVSPGSPTRANALSQAIKKLTGWDVNPSLIEMGGLGLSTLLGAYGSKQQTNALEDIANRSDAQRAPALAAFNNALANPNSWYQSAPATGAVDSVLRKLSANVGNPALDPGALSQAASYNLGGYNDYLRTMGNLGLSGQDTSARLQTNAVMSNNNLYNALGSGISSLTSNQPNFQTTLQQMLDKYFKGGPTLA